MEQRDDLHSGEWHAFLRPIGAFQYGLSQAWRTYREDGDLPALTQALETLPIILNRLSDKVKEESLPEDIAEATGAFLSSAYEEYLSMQQKIAEITQAP